MSCITVIRAAKNDAYDASMDFLYRVLRIYTPLHMRGSWVIFTCGIYL